MESYTYDGVGNRKTSLQVDGYTYNESNQLTALGDGTTFAYDANGNMMSKTATGGTTGYSWDVENRLTQVTLPGGATVSFVYDPFGRRIRKSSGSGTTVYVYDGANAVAEYDGSGTLMARYTQGAGIDEPLAMQRGGTTSYYNADGLGSVTSLTNAAGTISGTYTYDSFGQTTSTASIANPYQYTGRENDPETGLYYYRARYYDPNTGRFLSEDPKRFFAGSNFYGYVKANPVTLVDPFGLTGSHPSGIDSAWNDARMLLSDADCAKFLKDLLVAMHQAPDLDLFLQNFDNTTFGYTPENDPFEAKYGPYDIAHVDFGVPHNTTVHVFPGARGDVNAPVVAPVLLHEVLHTFPYGFSDFDIAAAVGYKGSPADGLKPASLFFSNEMANHCKVNCGAK